MATATTTVPSESLRWRAVFERDARFDGLFVYGVQSTGIYCRPSCPSRRPRPDRVRLFDNSALAEQNGFRACLRCRPLEQRALDADAAEVIKVCRYLQSLEDGVPSLAVLSDHFGTSPDRLTRIFRKTLGITPWQYADSLQTERLRAGLQPESSVTDALYEAGYSSPSRVYERANQLLGMTPRTYRDGGKGVDITYAIVPCLAGEMLVAMTDKGVCAVHLGEDAQALEQGLSERFPAARLERDEARVHETVKQVIALLDGQGPHAGIPLDIQATAFQRRVWEALQAIPFGEVRTYSDVAAMIGTPTAARAVARACASNEVALVVPCHRVVPAAGGSGGYRWGKERKAALLAHERGKSGNGT
ncbi:MAG: bifunctional DNA-binding transcriptional regulator/O6-methylguanine-DNA methyltransferase Ada [Dehalococcoidia bacterium]